MPFYYPLRSCSGRISMGWIPRRRLSRSTLRSRKTPPASKQASKTVHASSSITHRQGQARSLCSRFFFSKIFVAVCLSFDRRDLRWRKESNGVSDYRLFDRLRRDERLETRDRNKRRKRRDERREGQRYTRVFLFLDHSSLESSSSSFFFFFFSSSSLFNFAFSLYILPAARA